MLLNQIKKHLSLKLALTSAAVLSLTLLLAFVTLRLVGTDTPGVRPLQTGIAVFGLVFVMLQTVLVMSVSQWMIREPMHKLIQSMQRIRDGQLNEKCAIESSDEFGELAGTVNSMLQRLSEIHANKNQIEQRLVKAEENLKFKKELEEKAKIIERMNHELTGAFNDVSLLYTVSQVLNSIVDVDDLINCVDKIFTEKFTCQSYMLFFVDGKSGHARLAAQKGSDLARVNLGREFPDLDGVAGKALSRKRSLYVPDIDAEVALHKSEIEMDLKGSVFAVPLMVRDEVAGVLLISRSVRNGFSPTDRQSLDSIVSQISVAYDRSKLYSKTREMSVRDELTGAFNRRHFHNILKLEIKRAQRFNRGVSLLMIDMDHFKQFNDSYGHLQGDELLKNLTKILIQNVREVDVVARFGGEEFVVVLPSTNLSDAVGVANKLRKLVKSQLKGSSAENDRIGKDVNLTVSIGVSSFPECASSSTDLIYTADMALYKAKKDGRDLVRTYQEIAAPAEVKMA